jgi:T5SS/PEP-CTERM-associated repeat protein
MALQSHSATVKTKLITWISRGAFFALMAATTRAATTNSWKSTTSGKWETAGNWSVHAPTSSDAIELITNASTKTITLDATTTSSTNTLTVENLYVAGTATSSNTLFLNNAGITKPLQIFGTSFTIETNASLVVSGSAISAGEPSGNFVIGSLGGHSSLVISNSGSLQCYNGQLSGNNNTITVTGPGSVWNLLGNCFIGTFGTGNTFTVSGGGAVKVTGPNSTSEVGLDATSRSNTVLVTGTGSVWNTSTTLVIGGNGVDNTLTITNGGAVAGGVICIVGAGALGSNNLMTITGTGSVFSNGTIFIGEQCPSNSVIVADGGRLVSRGVMGNISNSFNNTVTVTGTGSVWNLTTLNIGGLGASNKVTLTNGGLLLASSQVTVGSFNTASSNNLLEVSGGSLFVTNALGTGDLEIGPGGFNNTLVLNNGTVTVDNLGASVAGGSGIISLNGGMLSAFSATIANGLDFIVGGTNTSAAYIANGGTQFFENNLVVQRGTFTMNGGTVTVSQLVLTNGANCAAAINSGLFNTAGTFVTNGAQFVVGNGTAHANFHLLGGEHDFHDGLRVSNGASLTGCGTITGDVTIDAGGSIFATCDTLTFTGTVINNGALAANGATLEFYGPVINNNGLLFYNGGTTNFHGTFMNNGIVTNAGPVIITSITRTGNDVVVTAPSALDFDYQLRIANTMISPIWTNSGPVVAGTGTPLTFTDLGGATNKPNRFYQVDVIWPP